MIYKIQWYIEKVQTEGRGDIRLISGTHESILPQISDERTLGFHAFDMNSTQAPMVDKSQEFCQYSVYCDSLF